MQTENEVIVGGYTAELRGHVVYRAVCGDCQGSTCECLFKALDHSRELGVGAVVLAPSGAVLSRRVSPTRAGVQKVTIQ